MDASKAIVQRRKLIREAGGAPFSHKGCVIFMNDKEGL